jgi:hypothetical protein
MSGSKKIQNSKRSGRLGIIVRRRPPAAPQQLCPRGAHLESFVARTKVDSDNMDVAEVEDDKFIVAAGAHATGVAELNAKAELAQRSPLEILSVPGLRRVS